MNTNVRFVPDDINTREPLDGLECYVALEANRDRAPSNYPCPKSIFITGRVYPFALPSSKLIQHHLPGPTRVLPIFERAAIAQTPREPPSHTHSQPKGLPILASVFPLPPGPGHRSHHAAFLGSRAFPILTAQSFLPTLTANLNSGVVLPNLTCELPSPSTGAPEASPSPNAYALVTRASHRRTVYKYPLRHSASALLTLAGTFLALRGWLCLSAGPGACLRPPEVEHSIAGSLRICQGPAVVWGR